MWRYRVVRERVLWDVTQERIEKGTTTWLQTQLAVRLKLSSISTYNQSGKLGAKCLLAYDMVQDQITGG